MRDVTRSPIPRLWLPVVGLAGAVAAVDRRADAGDLTYFVHRGEAMLSAHWANTFADPTLQAGPLQLLLAGGVRSTAALSFAIQIGVAALLVVVLGHLAVPDRWRLLAAVGAVVTGLTHGAFVDGHLAEAVSPLLWVLAAVEARRGRTARAGSLVGASAGLELWGLLGVVVLALAPRAREAARGALVALVSAALLFAPFALAGSFRMFDYEWRVASGTLLGVVAGAGTHFGWPLRLVQAAAACGAGLALARALRRSVHSVWLVPLAVVVVRIALDPLAYGWYWLEAESLALVGAALMLTRPPHPVREAARTRGRAMT
ncbi:MAG TPA: hypothetical protein VE269_06185 [Gaiellaceae bacterium]|nr:hypothetical protein [Gaiellaceae bacterium]